MDHREGSPMQCVEREERKSDADEFAGVRVQALMKHYYGSVFPYKEFFSWLAYGNDSSHAQADSTFLERRELCFTLDGDIFVRYQSFKDADELRNAIMRKLPAKIDIGPVYTVDPKRRSLFAGAAGSGGQGFAPVERELVFDIDISDYDDVRTCCSEGNICSKCWPLMALAIEILDEGLREDFGFKCILWVFSGRRGIHCWVCDRNGGHRVQPLRPLMLANARSKAVTLPTVGKWFEPAASEGDPLIRVASLCDRCTDMTLKGLNVSSKQDVGKLYVMLDNRARILTDEMRSALARYFSVYKGIENGRPKIDLPHSSHCHPCIERAVSLIKESWVENVIRTQGLLDDEHRWKRLLQYFEHEEFAQQLDAEWSANPSDSVSRWEELVSEADKASKKGRGQQTQRAMKEVFLAHAYPRLDIEVTKKMNHLLKAPFCVHPKTGKVCVPLDPSAVWEFNPEEVPTVQQLLKELGLHLQSATTSTIGASRWEETSLAGCTRYFRTFLRSLVVDSQKALNRKAQHGRVIDAW